MVLGQVSISQRHGHGCVSKQFLNVLEAAAIAKKAHETGKPFVEWIGLILSGHRGYSLPLVKVLPNSDSFQKVNEVLWHFL